MSQLKKLTDDVVGIAVDALLIMNGTTTTLDVKNWLRDRGYFAKQDQVSVMVSDYYECDILLETEKNKVYTISRRLENGHYVYFLEFVEEYSDEEEDKPVVTVDNAPCVVLGPTIVNQATRPVTPARPDGLTNRQYIAMYMNVSSAQLGRELGISAASVRAYKANINR